MHQQKALDAVNYDILLAKRNHYGFGCFKQKVNNMYL